MIAYLRGICQAVDEEGIVVDVHGVGYRVFLSERDRALHQPGGDAEVLIHTIVREDAFALYGFATAAARDLFVLLLSVSGVGPKGALALLSAMTPQELAAAVEGERLALLTKAKGIGKRTAELIVVKLRGRLPVELLVPVARVTGTGTSAAQAGVPATNRDVLSALANLGYKAVVAEAALAQARESGAGPGFDAVLRATLALLRRPG